MTSVTDRFLRLTRRFDAAPERVFNAWVRPETANRWLFATPGDELHTAELDPRVGGRWTITARREGVDYTALGEYLDVDPPRRLVFTFEMPQFSPNRDVLTVEIEPDGDGCILTLTQAGIDIAAELAALPDGVQGGSEIGWLQMLDLLATTLAAGQP